MTDISNDAMTVGFRYMRLLRRQMMAIQKKHGLQGIDISVLALLVKPASKTTGKNRTVSITSLWQ